MTQSENVQKGLYPDAFIKFVRGKAKSMNDNKYHSDIYKTMLNDLIKLKNDVNDSNMGVLVMDIINKLHSLTNLKKRTVLYTDFALKLNDLKKIAQNYVQNKLHLKKYNPKYHQVVRKLYFNNICHQINKNNLSAHDAYILLLKIMCNLNVDIK